MRTTEIRDSSLMAYGIVDFMRVTVHDDGSLMIIHIDKSKDRDNSSIVYMRPEEVQKLKEVLNGDTTTSSLSK